jgi:cathepsin L
MMKLLILAAVLGLAVAAPLQESEYQFLFRKFIAHHNKKYHHDEFFDRYNTFKVNVETIRTHNAKGESWTMAVNEFADQTWEQFRAKRLGYKLIKNDYIRSQNTRDIAVDALPTSVDWNAAGKVTPVKDQGQCGSCWSFSTTGSVESIVAINQGTSGSGNVQLSEQQLVDCSTPQGNQGCNGGLMDQAFEFIISNGGLCTESAYPYTATGPNTCQTTCTTAPHTSLSSYTDVTTNSMTALATAVAQQPVSIAIEADQSGFQFYSSGVFSGACGTNLDHGVLATGYGTSNSQQYWIVKNSWGASWGASGYIWLLKDTTTNGGAGQCGIYMAASYPIQ